MPISLRVLTAFIATTPNLLLSATTMLYLSKLDHQAPDGRLLRMVVGDPRSNAMPPAPMIALSALKCSSASEVKKPDSESSPPRSWPPATKTRHRAGEFLGDHEGVGDDGDARAVESNRATSSGGPDVEEYRVAITDQGGRAAMARRPPNLFTSRKSYAGSSLNAPFEPLPVDSLQEIPLFQELQIPADGSIETLNSSTREFTFTVRSLLSISDNPCSALFHHHGFTFTSPVTCQPNSVLARSERRREHALVVDDMVEAGLLISAYASLMPRPMSSGPSGSHCRR